MPFGCKKKKKMIKKEEVEEEVKELLSKAKKVKKGEKIILLYNETKIGKLKEDVPLDEVDIDSVWEGPFGIKVELSWRGKFVGSLLLRDEL